MHLHGVLTAPADGQGHKDQKVKKNAGEQLQHGVGEVLAQDFHDTGRKLVCGLQLELCYGAYGQRGRVALEELSVPLCVAQLEENTNVD